MSKKNYKEFMCMICGWVYSEEKGCPEEGIAPGTKWESISESWECPDCGMKKEHFEMIEI